MSDEAVSGWVAIEGTDYTYACVRTVVSSGIHAVVRITYPFKDTVISFPREHLQDVLRTVYSDRLPVDQPSRTEIDTDVTGFKYACLTSNLPPELRPRKPEAVPTAPIVEAAPTQPIKHQVIFIGNHNMEARSVFEPIFQEFADKFGLPIYATNDHWGWRAINKAANQLEIGFWTTPASSVEKIYRTAFGEKLLEAQTDGLEIRGAPYDMVLIDIRDDEQVVAQFGPSMNKTFNKYAGTLYVPFDLPHCSTSNASRERTGKIMRAILQKLEEMPMDAEFLEAQQQEQYRRAEAESRPILAETIRSVVRQQENKQLSIVRDYENQAQFYAAKSKEYSDALVGAREALENIKRTVAKSLEGIEAEFDAIRNIEGVRMIAANREKHTINVLTEPIYIKYDGATYSIGTFDISFALDSNGQYHLYMRNISGQKFGYDHPHIHNGLPCLGNVKPVHQLFAAGEFAAGIAALMEYLRSYHPEGQYTSIDHWDRKEG